MTPRLLRNACLVVAFAAWPLMPSVAATPPIDCRHAQKAADRAICDSPEDLALDQEITALYNRGMIKFEPSARHRLAQDQLVYLRKRTGCFWAAHHSAHPGVAVQECIRASMEGRARSLRTVVDRGAY